MQTFNILILSRETPGATGKEITRMVERKVTLPNNCIDPYIEGLRARFWDYNQNCTQFTIEYFEREND